jgi:hypothetical protein
MRGTPLAFGKGARRDLVSDTSEQGLRCLQKYFDVRMSYLVGDKRNMLSGEL